MQLSVAEQLNGRVVLLTGGLGGVGSVCLEQLLRLTQVDSVLLLVRSKGHNSAHERVQKLLCGPLLSSLHNQVLDGGPNVFAKVHVVEGDLQQPGLGLSKQDRQLLLDQVEVVLHCAANLTLDAHIQRTLRTNYCGTRMLLDLSRQMSQLQAFVFVSTYYVNNFKPYNSAVKEEVHHLPLQLPGDPSLLTHSQLVELLLSLPPDQAADEAATLMTRLNFASTYAFGKLLTEQLVDDAATLPGVAKAIVRPSLVFSLAKAPYPGFCSGYAGLPSFILGYAAGFFHNAKGFVNASDAVGDVIPVDVVGALIIASAAAAAAYGPWPGEGARVYHAASSDAHPMLFSTGTTLLQEFWTSNPAKGRLPYTRLPVIEGRYVPDAKALKASTRMTRLKVWAQVQLLRLIGRSRQAKGLNRGFRFFAALNQPSYARSFICLVDNARELQTSLNPQEASSWCCVWDKDACMDWKTYLYTSLTGLRTLALKLPESTVVTPAPHQFVKQQGLTDTALMQDWMARSSNSSSSRQSQSRGKGHSNTSRASSSSGSNDLCKDVDCSVCHESR